MVINDEILAAYVDGTLPQDQVEEVRQYLASHPQELEQLVRVMDDYPREVGEEKRYDSVSSIAHSGIAISGAAFVVPSIMPVVAPKKIRKACIQANLTNLLNEIQ